MLYSGNHVLLPLYVVKMVLAVFNMCHMVTIIDPEVCFLRAGPVRRRRQSLKQSSTLRRLPRVCGTRFVASALTPARSTELAQSGKNRPVGRLNWPRAFYNRLDPSTLDTSVSGKPRYASVVAAISANVGLVPRSCLSPAGAKSFLQHKNGTYSLVWSVVAR